MQYPVMETFYSIQGEGFHQGRAAFFIRLAGCDVGCHWCDVKESWDAEKHQLLSTHEILEKVKLTKTDFVVITGGEPCMYNLQNLSTSLKSLLVEIAIETSGAYPLSGNIDWICISPKKFKAPLVENISKADELKIIVYNKSDFEWAEKYRKQCHPHCKLYLQAEWSKEKEMMPLLITYIQHNPQWNLSLQIHKYLNLP